MWIQDAKHGIRKLRETVIEFVPRSCIQISKSLNQPFNMWIPGVAPVQIQAIGNFRKAFCKISRTVSEVIQFSLIPGV